MGGARPCGLCALLLLLLLAACAAADAADWSGGALKCYDNVNDNPSNVTECAEADAACRVVWGIYENKPFLYQTCLSRIDCILQLHIPTGIGCTMIDELYPQCCCDTDLCNTREYRAAATCNDAVHRPTLCHSGTCYKTATYPEGSSTTAGDVHYGCGALGVAECRRADWTAMSLEHRHLLPPTICATLKAASGNGHGAVSIVGCCCAGRRCNTGATPAPAAMPEDVLLCRTRGDGRPMERCGKEGGACYLLGAVENLRREWWRPVAQFRHAGCAKEGGGYGPAIVKHYGCYGALERAANFPAGERFDAGRLHCVQFYYPREEADITYKDANYLQVLCCCRYSDCNSAEDLALRRAIDGYRCYEYGEELSKLEDETMAPSGAMWPECNGGVCIKQSIYTRGRGGHAEPGAAYYGRRGCGRPEHCYSETPAAEYGVADRRWHCWHNGADTDDWMERTVTCCCRGDYCNGYFYLRNAHPLTEQWQVDAYNRLPVPHVDSRPPSVAHSGAAGEQEPKAGQVPVGPPYQPPATMPMVDAGNGRRRRVNW